MPIDLAPLQADTSSIVADWSDPVVYMRASRVAIPDAAGETTNAWVTMLATTGDIQDLSSVFTGTRRRSNIDLGGGNYQAEVQVFHRAGVATGVEGCRFAHRGEVFYVRAVTPLEDHVVVYASRKERIGG